MTCRVALGTVPARVRRHAVRFTAATPDGYGRCEDCDSLVSREGWASSACPGREATQETTSPATDTSDGAGPGTGTGPATSPDPYAMPCCFCGTAVHVAEGNYRWVVLFSGATCDECWPDGPPPPQPSMTPGQAMTQVIDGLIEGWERRWPLPAENA